MHYCVPPWLYAHIRQSRVKYVAIAHSMLVAIYHMLKDGAAFCDFGTDYYNQFNKAQKIHAYLKKLIALGWQPGAMTGQSA